MYECGYCHPIGNSPITPWAEKISSAQVENIKKNFASVKPMNEKPLALQEDVSAAAVKDVSAVEPTKRGAISVIRHVTPYYTGYSRIDNAIVDALKGKSQELKDNVYDIIWSDLLPSNVHGLDEADRKALISLGVEKAQYLADNFMDDKTKDSFMDAMRQIAKIGMEGKRVGTCGMEYSVKHVIQIDGDGYVHDSNADLYIYAMEKSDPKAFAAYKKLLQSSKGDEMEAAFFTLHWAMKHLTLVEANRTDYEKLRDERYKKLDEVKLDQTFSGADTSSKESFLASIKEKLNAARNPNIANTEFFLKRIEEMTRIQGKYLIGRQRVLAARA